MESFSLLKYWRGGGGGGAAVGGRGGLATSVSLPTPRSCHASATLGATVLHCGGDDAPVDYYGDEDDCSSSSSGAVDDEGPFFDLEFSAPDDEEDDQSAGVLDGSEDGSEAVRSGEEFGFAVEAAATPSDGSAACGLSPSRDDLFFKGRLVPLETTSSSASTTTAASLVLAEPNSRQQQHQFLQVSTLLKSATRFRVFALGLKKGAGGNHNSGSTAGVTKTSNADPSGTSNVAPSPKHPQQSSNTITSGSTNKFFTVKYLKVVEEVPIMSLFSRESSSRSTTSNKAAAAGRQSSSSVDVDSPVSSCVGSVAASTSSTDEKKFSKELVHKYLNKIKPLYVRVSKRHADKLEQQQQRSSSTGQQQQVKPTPASTTTADTVDPSTKELLLPDSTTSPVTAPADDLVQKPQPIPAAEPVLVPDTRCEKQQHLVVLQGTANCKPTTIQKEKALSASVTASAASQHIQAGLRVVCKHLGKSRSASSAAVAAAPSPPPSHAAFVARRRDDSLLQQQDGIQSAIAHCKRSFNATRADDTAAAMSTSDPAILPRSRSDSCADDQRCGVPTEVVAPPQRISADSN